MRRYVAMCFLLLGALIPTACGGGSATQTILPTTSLATSTVRVQVVAPFKGFAPVAGAAVTYSTDVNNNTGAPINVVATQTTDANGNTTFAINPNVNACFTTPITPTYGLLYAVDCNFPPESPVTLNKI